MTTGIKSGNIIKATDTNIFLKVDGTTPMTENLNCNNLYGIINVGKIQLNSNMYGKNLPDDADGSKGDVFFLLEET